jgi:hypothetical protein
MVKGKIDNSEGFIMAGEAHIPATRPGDEEPTVSALPGAESLIVQNKANWEEVSSLELRVSSSGPALQTSHSPETAFRRRQGLPCKTKPI